MQGFGLITRTPSYDNAVYAGSLSHTGNSFRPIGAPVKVISNPVASIVQPTSYSPVSVPKANPVRVTRGLNGSQLVTAPISVPRASPVTHNDNIRGIFGS